MSSDCSKGTTCCKVTTESCEKVTKVEKKKAPRRLGANQIPDSILQNQVLNDAIAKLLPNNYNFEIHKTIYKIRLEMATI